VWPWSYLVPWMEADMERRRAGIGAEVPQGNQGADPYDHSLYMSMQQFVEEPLVQELLHNGAALQVEPWHVL
jgi:hypothetical protein